MTISDEFERGKIAGEIAQRLKGHDEHFAAINGQLGRIGDEMQGLKLQLARVADGITANLATVATTATAVEKERASTARAVEDQRTALRDSNDKRWSPLARIGTMAGIATAAAALLAWAISHIHG